MIRPRTNAPGLARKGVTPPKPQQRRLPQIDQRILALGAVGVVAAIAFGVIQIFGDPSAAGPRRVVALAPGEAAASAPRIAFEDAAIDMGGEFETFSLDELPQTGEVGEVGTDGELRVSVVESSATPPRPTASPLPARADRGAHRARPERVVADHRRQWAHAGASVRAAIHARARAPDGGDRDRRAWLQRARDDASDR